MRKLIVSIMVSVDGFIEGPHKNLDHFVDDDELFAYFDDLLSAVDIMIYGRKAYDLMVDYWPAASGPFAQRMNEMPKMVFSRTMKKAEWDNTVVKDDVAGTIPALKKQPGKDLVLFAGADLLSTFRQLDLVDEYRLIMYPVILGSGTPLFQHVPAALSLKLVNNRAFGCGAVMLYYEPVRS